MLDSASNQVNIFTESALFFEQLCIDVENAQKSVSIQCMSFEADETGCALIDLLISKPNLKRTLLIDCYSKYVVNDTFLFSISGLFNKNNALTERLALSPLLKRAEKSGVVVKFTNPIGLLMWKYPARNHKKMVLIDDKISYVGGVNFTDHNFEWPDLMIRHISTELNHALGTSFKNDFEEKKAEPVQQINADTKLYTLNGLKTKGAYQNLLNTIKNASKVVAVSPYISYPMLDAIGNVAENFVILPGKNNKNYMTFIHRLKRYESINYTYTNGSMIHMKLLIVDDETIVYGSSNFDLISYLFEKEIIIQKKDRDLAQKLTQAALKLIN